MDWLGRAWDDYLDNFGDLLALTLLQVALNAPIFLAVAKWQSYTPGIVYALVVLAPFSLGVNLFYIKLVRGEKAGLAQALAAFPAYPRALAVTVGLGALTACGLLCFVLPGLVLYSMYCFSEYIVLDRSAGVKDSFLFSAQLSDGWKFPIAMLVILTVAVDALAPNPVYFSGWAKPGLKFSLEPWVLTAFCLKTFVFLPWLHLAMARAYDSLLALHLAPPSLRPAGETEEGDEA